MQQNKIFNYISQGQGKKKNVYKNSLCQVNLLSIFSYWNIIY